MPLDDQSSPCAAVPIGKKPQHPRVDVSYDDAAGPARGILRRKLVPGVYGHARRVPDEALRPWIMHYWMVNWDLAPGVTETVETLPHPNVQLVFTSGDPPDFRIHGVHTKKFTRTLKGKAQVFGVKFQAGGFRAFLTSPVAALRDKTVAAADVFGPGIDVLASALLREAAPEEERIAAANAFFAARTPVRDPDADSAASLVDRILKDPEVRSVSQLAESAGSSARTIQRLFRDYVGVSPKWVIRRYRLHELVERLNSGECADWAAVALELGYFDQSHLIRDFRQVTGYAPERYRTSAGEPPR